MERKYAWIACMTWLMGGLLGCGSDSAATPDLYTQVTDAEDSAIANACTCYAALGFPSENACATDLAEYVTADEATCLADVYDTYATELQTMVDCRVDALTAAEDCLNAVAACDMTAVLACVSMTEAALDACPEPGMVVEQAINDCVPNLYDVERAAEVAAIGDLCDCYASLGYGTQGECFTDFGGDDPGIPVTSCLQDAYQEYRGQVAPRVECRVAALQDAVTCVQAVAACDMTELQACIDAAETATGVCPEPSMAVQDTIDACYP